MLLSINFGFIFCKVWVLATSAGELLACQPYAGASTQIKDFGLGQGPNVVLGLCEQFGLRPGSKVYVDNLFLSMDLLDHMGRRQLGVTGTLRQNRVHGIPLRTKKEAEKKMFRGETQAVYTKDCAVIVWKDNKAVFMASNCDDVEPMGQCERYSRVEKKYVPVPQPAMNLAYNTHMGGVDLLDNSEKNYAITTRVKKWYWPVYTWFLNMCMVQSWRLYRAHMRERTRLALMEKEAQDIVWEREMMDQEGTKATKASIDKEKKDREQSRKKWRSEEKKKEEISLLEFTRQVVELTIQKHGAEKDRAINSQKEASAMLSPGALKDVRYDSGRHLPRLTNIKGVCKNCKEQTGQEKRTLFRCDRCKVALHAECFLGFHTSI